MNTENTQTNNEYGADQIQILEGLEVHLKEDFIILYMR